MENKDVYVVYDAAIARAISQLKPKKQTNIVYLTNFNPKDKNHLCIYQAMDICHSCFKTAFVVDMPLIPYWTFTNQHKCKSFVKRGKDIQSINCADIVKYVEESLKPQTEQNVTNILAAAYEAYYGKKVSK